MSGERAAETVGEYTPTTDEVRPWIDPMRQRFSDDEIDRWLAATSIDRPASEFLEEAETRGARSAARRITEAVEGLPTTRTQALMTGWDSVSLADVLRVTAEQTGGRPMSGERAGTGWTPTDEQVEAAASAVREAVEAAPGHVSQRLAESIARAALLAVAPAVRAQALTEAVDALEGRLGIEGTPRDLWEFREWLRARAGQTGAGR